MNIPAKLREEFGESFRVAKTIGQPCLTLYTDNKWNTIIEKIDKLSFIKAAKFERFLVGSSDVIEPDKQGRALIPASLREYAGLKTEIVIVGMTGQAEIWSKKDYDDHEKKDNMSELEAISEEF